LSNTAGKLAGVRVLDLSQFLPGPMLTLMMADQGADVLKIEPPGGDPARAMAPSETGYSVWFRNLNRGKRARALDLKSDEGRAALWDEIAGADVLVEGFRPGVMARLGFDYATVAARHPRLIYCSLSAFGQTGPLAHHPAHDLAVQALTGFLSVNDGADGAPAVPGVPSADMAVALTGLSAVLMALIGRERSGRGDHIDAAMFDALLPWTSHLVGPVFTEGRAPRSDRQRSLGGAAFYHVYQTADARHIVLAGREPKFVATLMAALGRPDLARLNDADDPAQQAILKGFLRNTFANLSRDAWVAWFADKDVAFAPVLDFTEAFAEPQVAARGLLIEADGAHHIAPAIRFASDPPFAPRPAPPPD